MVCRSNPHFRQLHHRLPNPGEADDRCLGAILSCEPAAASHAVLRLSSVASRAGVPLQANSSPSGMTRRPPSEWRLSSASEADLHPPGWWSGQVRSAGPLLRASVGPRPPRGANHYFPRTRRCRRRRSWFVRPRTLNGSRFWFLGETEIHARPAAGAMCA